MTAWFAVRQIVQGLNFNRAHRDGMSATQFMALGLLEETRRSQEPTTSGWLATRLNLDPATVGRTVDSLEKRGYVERRRDVGDRRRVLLGLTEEGHAAQRASRERFRNSVSAIFRSMSEEGRAALVRGLSEFASAGRKEVEEESGRD